MLHEASARIDGPDKGKVEAATTSAWETVLNEKKIDNAQRDYERVEDHKLESGTAQEDAKNSVETMLQDVIADEVKQRVENALMAILELVKETAEQLFRAANLSVQAGICTFLYEAM